MDAHRSLDFRNAPNLRDLGGIPAANDRTTRHGLVFRSDDLSKLDDGEVERLAALHLRTVVDFRSRQEVLYSPDILPATVAETRALPIDAGRLIDNFYGGTINRRKVFGIMVSVYRQLAREFTSAYAQFFAALADAGKTPLLFHCTAGKDRTGFAAALFLSSLGVERQAVIDDYLYSAKCLRKKYRLGVNYDDVYEPLYTVFPEFIAAAFEVVDAEPGGVMGYLENRLGVDIGYMRETFTEFSAENTR